MSVIKNLIFVCLLSLSFVSNSFSKDLDILFKNLLTAKNYQDAEIIEQSIWESWNIHPEKQNLTKKLANGTRSMNKNNYGIALELFTEVIKEDPKWAEAWNKRATLLFLIGNYSQSLKDIEKVLDLEPRHFGALSGRAQIYLSYNQYEKALEDLKRAKSIYPYIKSGTSIKKIEEIIKELQI